MFENRNIYRNELGLNDEIVVFSVGQMIPRKGYDILAKACKYLNSKVKIIIAGGYPEDNVKQIIEENHITNMKLEEYLNFFMPKLNDNQIKELIEKCRKDISPRIMEKYLTPELNEFLIFSKNYGESVDMILQYSKILYEHLVHFVEERHLMNYSPLIAINNLYTNIDSLHNNEIGLVYGYLKQAIDLNFLVNLSQDTIMLKICKFCHKAFIPKNSKAEYDTPQCKNKANVYSFRKRAQEDITC